MKLLFKVGWVSFIVIMFLSFFYLKPNKEDYTTRMKFAEHLDKGKNAFKESKIEFKESTNENFKAFEIEEIDSALLHANAARDHFMNASQFGDASDYLKDANNRINYLEKIRNAVISIPEIQVPVSAYQKFENNVGVATNTIRQR